ncbi:MAG TPA: hypothetical protein PLU24_00145 [Candidatus Omnitrophota bacterium]|nr:hypothetical protein [Candidatus Omnitrophota bacterium]
MTKILSNSPHKIARFFLYCAVITCVFIALVNISVSILLNDSLRSAQQKIEKEEPGLTFSVRFAYFNMLRGLTMYGVECRQEGEPLFSARRLDIGFDGFSLRKWKLRIKNIRLRQANANLSSPAAITRLFNEKFWKIKIPLEFFDNVVFEGTDIGISDSVFADIKGYLSLIKGTVMVSRGELRLKKIQMPALPQSDLFKGSPFYKPFDFLLEAEINGDDFVISRFDMSNPNLKFTGKGNVGDFRKKAEVDLRIDFMNIILDDFPELNKDGIYSHGLIDARLDVKGAAEDLKTTMNIRVTNAELRFYDALLLTKINGSAVVGGDHVVGQNFSLYANKLPFRSDFALSQRVYPHLLLRMTSLPKTKTEPSLILDVEADSMGKELVGVLKSKFRYLSGETINSVQLNLDTFRFGYEEEMYIGANTLNAVLTLEPVEEKRDQQVIRHEVNLEHPFCVLRRSDEGFVLDSVKGNCYGGTFEARLDFTTDGSLGIKGEGHLREVNLDQFFKERKEGDYILTGLLDGDLRFDTKSHDMIKGQFFVSDGTIEENPLLNAVSDFLGVLSLKKVNFRELAMFFSGGHGEYSSQVKLESPRVSANLDGKIIAYDKMDGFLDISLATELLNESKTFKKILTYIRHDEPAVLFSFKISSYINSPRSCGLKMLLRISFRICFLKGTKDICRGRLIQWLKK